MSSISSIQTYSGILIDLKDPDIETILVPDIAHHLATLNRFTGAARFPYSIGQHSLLVSNLINQDSHEFDKYELKFIGLLHDSAEAFLNDVASPLKSLLPDYKKLEKIMNDAIIKRFNLCIPDFECVKLYDKIALDIESRALLGPRHSAWGYHIINYPADYVFDYTLKEVRAMTWQEVEQEYLRLFNELWLKR